VEDSVDALVKRLESKGKKIKIIEEGANEEGEKSTKSKAKNNNNSENADQAKNDESDEDRKTPTNIELKMKELERLEQERQNLD
jgi:hypothetical protein